MTEQLELTDGIIKLANSAKGEGVNLVVNIRNLIYESIKLKPYNDENKEDERKIRWKRTADQILKDGYVFQGKACTDIVIVFLALAKARGFETRFVKIFKANMVHSVAEIKIGQDWYVYDVASKNAQPEKGEFLEGKERNGWKLWKKGIDAWDLGLEKYDDIQKIK